MNKFSMERNKPNKVRCGICNDIIESNRRHEFVTCKCGHVSVDGGSAYRRRCWNGEPNWFEISSDGTEVHVSKKN